MEKNILFLHNISGLSWNDLSTDLSERLPFLALEGLIFKLNIQESRILKKESITSVMGAIESE